MSLTGRWVLGVLAFLGMTAAAAGADMADELVKQARAALTKGQGQEALTLASKAVTADPTNAEAYLVRGTAHELLGRHTEAIADFTKTVELDPKAAEAYNRRGSERFKTGDIKGSLTDFDRYLELKPDEMPGHWKRGISLYYAGRYEDGARQFTAYEKVDTNDVENAVWHFLCMARASGVEKARGSLLKIGNDKRVPMMQVYALYKGEIKPADVLTAARAGEPPAEQLNQRLFYAHLYLGLYHEVLGDRKLALEHMQKAAEEHRIGHYMGDVARVHLELLRKDR